MIAANVQLISNNHDPYDKQILTCKPIRIKYGAWVGAGANILTGVIVGKYSIIGANSVDTKDIPDYDVSVVSPTKVIKYLDKKNSKNKYIKSEIIFNIKGILIEIVLKSFFTKFKNIFN